ncbi:FecR family protein [Wocania ichthyoenteri]|uniref:FecR family protein n=1 Tax=Wocania ichthyoenteri TaxID=1230531 RepID=UPI00053E7F38|nr:FecR domain-containing protein [Wocania ichthyoenteri]
MNSKIEKSIIKFLAKEANLAELRELELWINNPKNEDLFYEFIKTNVFINKIMSKYDKKRAKENIVRRIKQERSFFNKKAKSNSLIKYVAAAILVGVLATSYIFKDNLFNGQQESMPVITANHNIKVGTDKATLTLGDGTTVTLEKGKMFQSNNIRSTGDQLVYNKVSNNKKEDIKYNYLTIPRGGQYFVKLSDGTQVWLNSQSQLKFPEVFIEGEPRKVELVYGEAYFDVSPSTEHKGDNFLVLNQNQEIEVLGTEFNIKAYKDETNIYTTLVEGKVVVNFNGMKQNLTPSQQSNINTINNNISIYNVDVESVVSWKNGLFTFKGKALKDIMKVISRWYDVDIIFLDKNLESLKFKGVLSKSQTIEEILSIMKSSTISDYEIKNKTIILK